MICDALIAASNDQWLWSREDNSNMHSACHGSKLPDGRSQTFTEPFCFIFNVCLINISFWNPCTYMANKALLHLGSCGQTCAPQRFAAQCWERLDTKSGFVRRFITIHNGVDFAQWHYTHGKYKTVWRKHFSVASITLDQDFDGAWHLRTLLKRST